MRNLVLSIAASAAVLAVAPLANAQAAFDGRLIFGVEPVGAPAPVQDVQFLFGGRNYCWYAAGWRGAGYYWCGYANRRGLGWGGPEGWHGWRSGGHSVHGAPIADAHGGHADSHGAPGGGHPGGGHPDGGHPDGGHPDGGRH